MFGINDALRERELEEGPIRVAIVGAGTMGGYMVHQPVTATGMNPDVVKALYDEADAFGFEILAAGRHDYGGLDIK
ncbi:MAG TPA: hypothetical protein VGD78_18475 [Chthoniobacterales bacterium]